MEELETIVEWQVPEHHYDRRGNDWYWALGIIAAGAAVLSFYFGNFLFAVFIILAALTIGLLSYKETRTVLIKITSQGFVVDKYLYPFRSQRSFWIEHDHRRGPRVLLHPLNNFLPLRSISIDPEIDLEKLRELLLEFMEEEFLEESLIHKLLDKIGL